MRLNRLLILLLLIISGEAICNDSDEVTIKYYLSKTSGNQSLIGDSAYYYANKALQLAQKISSEKYMSLCLQQIGQYFVHKEDFGKATKYFLYALNIEEKQKDELRMADLNRNLGYIYFQLERFTISMDYYTNSLELYRKNNDSTGIAKLYMNIGSLHDSREFCENRDSVQKKNDFETAIAYL